MVTAVGVFEEEGDARRAVVALLENGFVKDDISVALRDAKRKVVVEETGGEGAATAAGLAAGGVTGAIVGALLGMAALTVPGVGPLLAAGPIVSILAGTALGAATRGLIGALVDMGIPTERATVYEERVRAGNTLVTVRAVDAGEASRAATLMRLDLAVETEVF